MAFFSAGKKKVNIRINTSPRVQYQIISFGSWEIRPARQVGTKQEERLGWMTGKKGTSRDHAALCSNYK